MQPGMTSQIQKVVLPGFSKRTAAWIMAIAWMALGAAIRLSAGEKMLWTCDMVTDETSYISTNVVRVLKPINLVGARNGSFSVKVVVESAGAISGVVATVSALTGMGSTIPAQNVQLRYGKAWDAKNVFPTPRPDILLAAAPKEVVPMEYRIKGGWKVSALLPVWVTVRVPKEAKAGAYTGRVTVQGVVVPLNLDVQNWTLPDSQDYRTFTDFIESPDTLALEYNLPLWSEQHWKMIDRSFQLLSSCGACTLYIPLICRSNLGNEQSMVRWIPRGGGKYDYDFTVMDKYLDSAVKNMGKPKLVVFNVWDICMSKDAMDRGLWDKNDATGKARVGLVGKGPRVTALDAATKEASVLTLPRYEDAASKSLWAPLFAEIRKRMEKRGLDKTMMLGLMPDLWPNKEEVAFWKSISGDIPWAIHGHAGARDDVMIGKKGLYNISDIGYAAFVYNLIFNANPDKGRMYGWRQPSLLASYLRNGQMNVWSPLEMREVPVFAITGGQRGPGRLGGDFWPAVRNSKGARSGAVWARYPENNWRNLDILDWFLAPGPDGPVATARLEYLREGIQVCEARIFLEDALLDDAKKAKLGAELAKRCQDALDAHHRAMWKTVWNNETDLDLIGKVGLGRDPAEGMILSLIKAGRPYSYHGEGLHPVLLEEARKGQEQFVIGWQEREKKLFALSGEVAAKLNLQR